MIISFARTTAALMAGRKTVTRREWSERTIRMAQKACSEGQPVQAWDRSPRAGGQRVGWIRLKSVTVEPTLEIPDSDWEAEGFAYMAEHGLNVGADTSCAELWAQWRSDPLLETAVIRFEWLGEDVAE